MKKCQLNNLDYQRLTVLMKKIYICISDHLGKQLEEYVATLPVKTFVLRTGKRSGLIRARLLGAAHVKVMKIICY